MKYITPDSLSDPRFAREMWRALAAVIPDILVVVDRNGKILYINRTPAGVTRAQALASSALDYVPAASRNELQEAFQQLFATGLPCSRELLVNLPHSGERWYSTHAEPVRIEGKVAAAIIVIRDITDAKRAYFALAESEARNRALVEYAREAIVLIDADGCGFVDVNENACSLFGLERDLLLASSPLSLSPETQPDGRPSPIAAKEYLNSALEGDAPRFEWMYRDVKGAEINCDVRLVKMPSPDKRLVRGSFTDVTQQRRLEQQIQEWQKMDAIGQLAAGVAHDFHNILTMVMASADVLSVELKGDVLGADAQAIGLAARKGAALTSQLLSLARRQPATDDRVLDLNDVVMEMSTILTRMLGAEITLVLELERGRAPARIGRSQAEQVLMNLVLNARDAIVGEGSIHVTTRHRQADGHTTILSVRDTGGGMEAEVQRRMFEPFFSTKGDRGTGLGLSTVHGIVTQVGGTLGVLSTVGEGTTIVVGLRAE